MGSRACPDCPAIRTRTLEVLVERPSGCAFRCLAVGTRERLPASWSDEYAIALVRRGIVIRQRIDSRGEAVAFDVAGAGAMVPLPSRSDPASTAYVAGDTMLCLCPLAVFDDLAQERASGARDVVRAQWAALTRVERLSDARGRRAASSRVAALLLAIADTLVERRLELIPSSIQLRDLGLLAGLRHESICRELKSLERSGAVFRGDEGLHLIDRVALEHA